MKKKILRSDTPSINTDAFQSKSDLPTAQSVENFAEQLTGKIKAETKKLEMATKQQTGRVKFTTSLRADVVTWLKVYAAQNGGKAADVLENAVLFYMDYKKSLKG